MQFSFALGRAQPWAGSSRRAAWLPGLVAAGVGLAGIAAVPVSAANNPGTGDSGFFTFRPSVGVGGTQINVASGNALIRTRDLVDGPLTYHVVVDRFYNSLEPGTFTILSPRWGFDVGPDTKLTVESNQDATVRGPSGYRLRFERQSDGSYVAPDGFDGALVRTALGWMLSRTSAGDEFGFDGSGNLTWTKDSSLRDFTVQGTSAAGRTVLSSYGTSSGRRVNLSYNGDSLVRLMDDPASGHHSYRYTAGRLTEYESPTGATTTYGYDTNGFLDEIVEPGGTTVELDVAASGKIHAITTTLPGAVPQTTNFVYTRRTYKSDAIAPDGVRRTYAYDDDWRVTRQYNPDVAPTPSASGPLVQAAGSWIDGSSAPAVTLAAEEPEGAGLVRLDLADSLAGSVGTVLPPCVDTPFDHVCPTSYTETLQHPSLDSLPEGPRQFAATAEDDEGNTGESAPWTVFVDQSIPTAVLSGSLWDQRDSVIVDDDDDGDYGLLTDDGTVRVEAADTGSGVASVEVRVDGVRLDADDRVDAQCTVSGCPATLTADFSVDFDDVTEGIHTISVIVRDQVADAGSTTNSGHTRVQDFSVYFAPDPNTPDGLDDDTPPPGTGPANRQAPGIEEPAGGLFGSQAFRIAGVLLDPTEVIRDAAETPNSDLARLLGSSEYSIEDTGEIGDGTHADGSPKLTGAVAMLEILPPRAVDEVVDCYVPRPDGGRQAYQARLVSSRLSSLLVEIDGATGALICISPGPRGAAERFEPVPGQPALPAPSSD